MDTCADLAYDLNLDQDQLDRLDKDIRLAFNVTSCFWQYVSRFPNVEDVWPEYKFLDDNFMEGDDDDTDE